MIVLSETCGKLMIGTPRFKISMSLVKDLMVFVL